MDTAPLMRVVLDSNILLSALISPHRAPHRIYAAWRARRFELVTCPTQLEEIRRASRYPKLRELLQPHRVGAMVNALAASAVCSAPAEPSRLGLFSSETKHVTRITG